MGRTAFAALGLLMTALAACSNNHAGPKAASATVPASSPTPTRRAAVVVLGEDCTGTHYKPARISVACGDGAVFITGARWTTWTQRIALGVGLVHQNDCKPDCARGTFRLLHEQLRYSDPKTYKGQRVFRRLEGRRSASDAWTDWYGLGNYEPI